MVKSNSAWAGFSPASSRIFASTFRSIPPANVSLPEVMTMPLTASSASAVSTISLTWAKPSRLITFIDLPGTSQVSVATPSASTE